jgi:glyoxylate/hydroxypyruvate reductase
MAPGKAKLKVHIAALTSQHEVFWVTEDRFHAACERHPALAAQLIVDWSWDLEGFDESIRDADIMIGWKFDTHDIARRAPNLKWIQLTGAGMEHLQPLDWLPRGAALTNNSGVHASKAAEFAGTSVLALNNFFPHFSTQQNNRHWDKKFSTTIEEKTVLIVGLGGMGGAVARWLKQRLGLRVLGVRRTARPTRYVDEVFSSDQLDTALPQADFVVVTVPLTKETESLLDRRRLMLMKPGASIVNMGRARVIDYDVLAELLTAGRLSGAILDVFDPEPLPVSSYLWGTPNLMLVPHCSSDDAEKYIPLTLDMFFDNLGRFISGKPLKKRISTKKQY